MNSIRQHRSTVHQLRAVIAAGVGVLSAVALSTAASADPGERSSPSRACRRRRRRSVTTRAAPC